MTLLPAVHPGSGEPPRVLLVVDALHGGGAERHVVDLALGLRERAWKVRVACSYGAGVGTMKDAAEIACRLQDADVPVHNLLDHLVKRRVSMSYAGRVRRLLSKSDFDLVHAHIYASEVAAALAVSGSPTRLVVTEHTEAPWRGAVARSWSRWLYRRADQVIVVSAAIKRKLTTEYGVPFERIRVVSPVGREVVRCVRPAQRYLELPWRPLLGFIGRLEREKGLDVLLHAMADVVRRFPKAGLVVVGDGPERRSVERLAEGLGVASSVAFLGYRADVPMLLGDLDVLVVPSRTDGAPLVVHEAMVAGVPVVGSATGGIIDRLHHGSVGVLVPPGEAACLAIQLLRLLSDDGGRRRLGDAGRHAASAASFAGMLTEVEEIYRAVAGRARSRAGQESYGP